MERWEQPLRHPLAPEQVRSCRQPFPAAGAAGLRAGEDASFCCLQGRALRWAKRGFLHLSHTPMRAPLPGILALPVLIATIPLGGMGPQAGSRRRHQPCPELTPLPMPWLLTSLLTSTYRQPSACHNPGAHDYPSHCPGINATHPYLGGTPCHRWHPRALPCTHTATLLHATHCPYSLSRTAGSECLALEQMPASLIEIGLATVPSTRPARGWQVNVSLFLSAPPQGGCSFHSDEQMYLHFSSRWGAGLISLKFTFPVSPGATLPRAGQREITD